MSEHLGYHPRIPTGIEAATPATETALSRIHRPAEIKTDVPWDRAGTCEPQLAKKRRRRLTDVDELAVVAIHARRLADRRPPEPSRQSVMNITLPRQRSLDHTSIVPYHAHVAH